MQLRTRIGLSIVPVLILVFAIGLAGWTLDRTLRRNQAELDGLRDVERGLVEVRSEFAGLLEPFVPAETGTIPDDEALEPFEQRIESIALSIAAADRGLEDLQLGEVQTKLDRLRHHLDEVHRFSRTTRAPDLEAPTVALTGEQGVVSTARRDASALLHEVEQLRLVRRRDRDRIRQNAWLSSVLGIFSVVGMTLVVALYIYRSLRERLFEVRDAAEAIARGNFDLRIAVRESDAIGQIGETFNRMAATLAEKHQMLESDVFVTRQLDDLGESLELADAEEEAVDLTLRALEALLPGYRHLILLSDSSEAHLQLAGEGSGERSYATCSPGQPFRCKAIRMARVLRVEEPTSLRACPHFKPQEGVKAYVCAPLTVVGKSVGTLQIVDEAGRGFAGHEQRILRAVSDKFSLRLGVLRLLRKTMVQAQTDVLTGIPNRRSFLDKVGFLHTQAERTGSTYAVILADLDRFKDLNDRHGHAAGDAALRVFAKNMARNARRGDLICRYGGEEFLVVLPDAGLDTAERVAERLRSQTERVSQQYDGPAFTASFGIATFPECGASFQEVLDHADRALYQAKEEGRNTVRQAAPHGAIGTAATGDDPRPEGVAALEPDVALAAEDASVDLRDLTDAEETFEPDPASRS